MSTPAVIVDSHGKPARLAKDAKCPSCGAPPEKRLRTGFGGPGFEFCDACGFSFSEASPSGNGRG